LYTQKKFQEQQDSTFPKTYSVKNFNPKLTTKSK